MKLNALLHEIDKKKIKLDSLRPMPAELLKNMDQWFRVELTYSSNAVEGNTLTRSETAVVLEKGLTVSGKPLKDHLEAINHAYALDYIKTLVHKNKKELTLNHIKQIHILILKKIDDDNAGIWRKIMVRIAGSTVQLPEPSLVPALMEEFMAWLHNSTQHPAMLAIEAHYKFVRIHPFVAGNGRTARLFMNLLLMQAGYPPLIVDFAQRLAYINSIQKLDETGIATEYQEFMLNALEKSLNIYIDAVHGSCSQE